MIQSAPQEVQAFEIAGRYFSLGTDLAPESSDDWRPEIRAGEAVVMFFFGEATVRVWAAKSTGTHSLRLGETVVGDLNRCLWALRDASPRRECDDLERSLIEPLSLALGDAERIVVVPHGPVTGLPSAFLQTRLRAALHGRPVVMSYAPTLQFALRRREWRFPDSVAVLTGEGAPGFADLPAAQREGLLLREVYPATTKVEPIGSLSSVQAIVQGADVLAVSAHATAHRIRPSLSAIHLREGDLTARTLRTFNLARVRLAVVLSCEADNDLLGGVPGNYSIARAMVAAGAGAVIAGVGPVSDLAAGRWSSEIHRGIVTGMNPAAVFARLADNPKATDEAVPLSFYAGLGFLSSVKQAGKQ
jgi:CHAT domain